MAIRALLTAALLPLLLQTATGMRFSPFGASWSALSQLFGQSNDEQPQGTSSHKSSECDDLDHRKATMKLIKEIPFTGLFPDLKGQTKFEGSGMVEYEGKYLVVFDSLMALGSVDDRFQFRDPANVLVGEPGPESQFEGISVMETGKVLLLQESMLHGDEYKPETLEVEIAPDMSGYTIERRCIVDFTLSHSNKGFEGMHYYYDGKDGRFLLGLCEGNHCSGGSRGRESGNGRLVITQLQDLGSRNVTNDHTHDCVWEPIKVVDIPPTAYFQDYSEIAFRGTKVAITSQENSALWLAEFDFEAMEFVGEGRVYHFPRDNDCRMVYCNVEGIEFIDDVRLIVTSDKSKRYQPYECMQKDQALHIFTLPN